MEFSKNPSSKIEMPTTTATCSLIKNYFGQASFIYITTAIIAVIIVAIILGLNFPQAVISTTVVVLVACILLGVTIAIVYLTRRTGLTGDK